MAVIPNVNVDHLRPDFKDRIDKDKISPRRIWCKSGAGKKKHQLLDCPNAVSQAGQRTTLSEEVFGAGHEDYAVAYIHQLQLVYRPRQDSMTPFSSGRPRYQISSIPDVPQPTPIATSSASASSTATGAASTGNNPVASGTARTRQLQQHKPLRPRPSRLQQCQFGLPSLHKWLATRHEGHQKFQQGSPLRPLLPPRLFLQTHKVTAKSHRCLSGMPPQ